MPNNKDLQDLKAFANIRAYGNDDRCAVYSKGNNSYGLAQKPSTPIEFKNLIYVGGQENN